MDNLFSHRANEPLPTEPLPPVACSVTVPVPPEQAFDGFTDAIHLWWPLAEDSLFGAGSYVGFEEGNLVETAEDGRTSVWAEVDGWEPPRDLRLAWHRGTGPLAAQELEVVFLALDGATHVEVVHGGWELVPDGRSLRAHFERAWPQILARYQRFMGG